MHVLTSRRALAKKNPTRQVFPGQLQGDPLEHVIASRRCRSSLRPPNSVSASSALDRRDDSGRASAARRFTRGGHQRGVRRHRRRYRCWSTCGVELDKQAEDRLHRVGITVNRAVPFDHDRRWSVRACASAPRHYNGSPRPTWTAQKSRRHQPHAATTPTTTLDAPRRVDVADRFPLPRPCGGLAVTAPSMSRRAHICPTTRISRGAHRNEEVARRRHRRRRRARPGHRAHYLAENTASPMLAVLEAGAGSPAATWRNTTLIRSNYLGRERRITSTP